MQQLINDYKESLKEIRRLILNENLSEEDKKLLRSMASDLQYALEWMKTGRRPDNRRGIERRAAYQRERPFDPVIMQRYFRSSDQDIYSWDDHKQENCISQCERERIEDALSPLTDREKEIYLMSRGQNISMSQIAEYKGIKKSTVQDTLERAENKIANHISYSLFNVV